MRSIKLLIYSLIIAAVAMPARAFDLGFVGGLSTPNDEMENVYNQDLNSLDDLENKFIMNGMDMGWHFGARLRQDLSDNLSFVGGLTWHHFPESEIEIEDPDGGEILGKIETSQDIVSFSAGLNFYLFRGFISPYATGELGYNFLKKSVSVKINDQIAFPANGLPDANDDSRFGFAIGAGTDIDIKLLQLNLEAKYNIANLIGAESDEDTKSYFTLSLGLYF